MKDAGANQVARSRNSASQSRWEIPIVDGKRRIIGWSHQQPILKGNDLRNPDAERLLGRPLGTVEIELTDPEHVRRAGAPAPWPGPWRCLALCLRDETATGFEMSSAPSPMHTFTRGKSTKRSDG